MIETIIKGDLPNEFSGACEAKGIMNWIYNYFHEDGPDRTHWVMDTEFKFSGFMIYADNGLLFARFLPRSDADLDESL